MKNNLTILLVLMLTLATVNALFTSKMLKKRMQKLKQQGFTSDVFKATPSIQTSCSIIDLSKAYNYTGIVASGYLTVGKNNSALAFTFYGKKDVQSQSQLKNYPTVIWLNGGPGSSSQMGNMLELGPLLLHKTFQTKIVANNFTWVNNFNVLFVDQPVGTGLSYADTTNGANPFAKSLDEVAQDFYRGLFELYNGKGCFSPVYLNIPPSHPIVIFGQSYGGKYAPAIAKKIVQARESGGFLTGLRGMAIGDGFTNPYEILSEVGTYAYHLSLIDFQERSKLEKVLLNASRHDFGVEWDWLHDDFDRALDYVVEKAGNVNVYDIRIDGEYEDLIGPYFRNESVVAGIYSLNPEVVFQSQGEQVYNHLYTDFMKPQTNRVDYLLNKGLPVLIYNGQMDLIVPTPGTTKWVDHLSYGYPFNWREKLYSPWKIGDKMVGTVKSAGLLQFRVVFNAGHLVPMDQPEASLDMATNFVNRVSLGDTTRIKAQTAQKESAKVE